MNQPTSGHKPQRQAQEKGFMKEQKETYIKPELVAHAPLSDLTATASHHSEDADSSANPNAKFNHNRD